MTRPGPGPTDRPPRTKGRPVAGVPGPRPPAVDVAAAILAFGGLFGLTQLIVGDFAITGSLPVKEPILGVAVILYAASTVLGLAVRIGRFWLPALNLAGVFAVLYLLAMGRLLQVGLGLAYAGAFAILLAHHRWFADVRRAGGRPAA